MTLNDGKTGRRPSNKGARCYRRTRCAPGRGIVSAFGGPTRARVRLFRIPRMVRIVGSSLYATPRIFPAVCRRSRLVGRAGESITSGMMRSGRSDRRIRKRFISAASRSGLSRALPALSRRASGRNCETRSRNSAPLPFPGNARARARVRRIVAIAIRIGVIR